MTQKPRLVTAGPAAATKVSSGGQETGSRQPPCGNDETPTNSACARSRRPHRRAGRRAAVRAGGVPSPHRGHFRRLHVAPLVSLGHLAEQFTHEHVVVAKSVCGATRSASQQYHVICFGRYRMKAISPICLTSASPIRPGLNTASFRNRGAAPCPTTIGAIAKCSSSASPFERNSV